YASLDEPARAALLARELASPRPLTPINHTLSDESHAVLDVLDAVRDARRIDPAAVGCYIVSMTHEVSDLLEVLLLMKERGLLSPSEGEQRIDLVPLFETVDDLRRAPSLLTELFREPAYREHLAARDSFQEIM